MIRPFSFADLQRILEIERQAFPKAPYDVATFLNLYWAYPETFLVYVERTHGWQDGRIFGYIVFDRGGHIISVAVDPARRRKGIGRALLARVLDHPRVRKARAEVRVSNKGAQAFYREMGFQVVGSIPNYYGDEDALLVEKNAR